LDDGGIGVRFLAREEDLLFSLAGLHPVSYLMSTGGYFLGGGGGKPSGRENNLSPPYRAEVERRFHGVALKHKRILRHGFRMRRRRLNSTGERKRPVTIICEKGNQILCSLNFRNLLTG
jgi:hypothetical protein